MRLMYISRKQGSSSEAYWTGIMVSLTLNPTDIITVKSVGQTINNNFKFKDTLSSVFTSRLSFHAPT